MRMDAAVQARLDSLYHRLERLSAQFLGYPCNLAFDYTPLHRFLELCLNNVGDPFVASNFGINTHEIEREVIQFFARLTRADGDVWGYVTHGGTEGNMYGLYLARELYREGIVYYSQDTHYSVTKILKLINTPHIMIRSQDDGQIDYEDLRETLRIKRDVPAIVLANIGTTMKGAVDDVGRIRDLFKALALEDTYVHGDAALAGMILPFVEPAQPFGFDAGLDSLSISGHKFIGSPIPCGVVLAKKQHVDRIARAVEYVGTLDTTLSGSRNGLTPLFLWYAITQRGTAGFKAMVAECFRVADYAIQRLKAEGLQAWRHAHSITVVLPRPSQALLERWQLAAQHDIAHLVIMPHVTCERIDRFMEDMKREAGRG